MGFQGVFIDILTYIAGNCGRVCMCKSLGVREKQDFIPFHWAVDWGNSRCSWSKGKTSEST